MRHSRIADLEIRIYRKKNKTTSPYHRDCKNGFISVSHTNTYSHQALSVFLSLPQSPRLCAALIACGTVCRWIDCFSNTGTIIHEAITLHSSISHTISLSLFLIFFLCISFFYSFFPFGTEINSHTVAGWCCWDLEPGEEEHPLMRACSLSNL